ncbi:hypothetical protein B7P34_05565 [Streptosporangium nondiastaticum]|uniref:CYTH domain-containing protein n=1 Tax=Streptosporangium nondiastaticum TaxID=35764 RepID=A0A9X7PJ00_9ACTN|nr:hypothetical protein [Streptosporangium nondiastaticum]PSJ29724.1 hypothetical protein B7P34_05565 [Streptosporangium nondiastaticum]
MGDTFRNAKAEIKIIFVGDTAEDACRSLALAPEDGTHLNVCFWDAPQADGPGIRLPLAEAGAIIRLRKPTDGGKGDLTAKLRPCDPATLPRRWRQNRSGKGWKFKIEEDWNGPDRVWSASLKVDGPFGQPVDEEGAASAAGPRLTPDQRDLLAVAGVLDDHLRGTVALGPVRAIKWKLSLQGLPHPLTAEFWRIGADGLHFLELSLRARPADAPRAQNLLEHTVLARGLSSAPQQASKTRTVMAELARNHLRRCPRLP